MSINGKSTENGVIGVYNEPLEEKSKRSSYDASSLHGHESNFIANISSIESYIYNMLKLSTADFTNLDDRIKLCINNDINIASALANGANRNGPIMGNFVSFANAKKFLGDTFALISNTLSDLEKIAKNDQIKDKSPEQKLLSSITGMLGRYIPGESIGSLSDSDPSHFTEDGHNLCSIKKEIDNMLKSPNEAYSVKDVTDNLKKLIGTENSGLKYILSQQNEIKISPDLSADEQVKNIAIQRTQDFQTIQILCGTNDLAQTLNEILTEAKNKAIKALTDGLLEELNKTGLKIDAQLATVSELRKNDFFYEYSWKDLDESITDILVSFFKNDDEKALMRSLIKADLLASREATGSADGIKSGVRGRTVAKDIAKKIAGRESREKNFFCFSYDDGSGSNEKILDEKITPETKALIDIMQVNKAFDHSFRPAQFATGNMIDSKRVEIINNPVAYMYGLLDNFSKFGEARFNDIPQFAKQMSELCKEKGDNDLAEKFTKSAEDAIAVANLTKNMPNAKDAVVLVTKNPNGRSEQEEKEREVSRSYVRNLMIFNEKYKDFSKEKTANIKQSIIDLKNSLSKLTETILNHPISMKRDESGELKDDKLISELVTKILGKYESKPNLAAAMLIQGLRTICSVSGTTTDFAAVLWAINEEKTKAALTQLNEFTKGGCKDFSKLGDEFKDLFLSVALYMQSGQYHSAAEVLSGLCCSAQTLIEGNVVIEVQDDRLEPYSTLMEAFQQNPSKFFPGTSDIDQKQS